MSGGFIEGVSVSDLFERFIEATTMKNVISIHKKILNYAELQPCGFNNFFPKYKRAITSNRQKKNWKAKALFSKIEKKANHKCYSNTKALVPSSNKTCDSSQTENDLDESLNSQSNSRNYLTNNALQYYRCLIIGSGPAGLRTAIELQLLGADKVVIVEKRSRFSRNNVLHLWPFVIDDLKSLGAKKFYGKFCAGSIDHISIRQLQLILLKVCLMIGCDFRDSCSYRSLCPSSIKQNVIQYGGTKIEANNPKNELDETQTMTNYSPSGTHQDLQGKQCDDNQCNKSQATKKQLIDLRGARALFEADDKMQSEELQSIEWDIVIGADGRRNTLRSYFPRKEFRGRLAIAITANFINRQTPAETSIPEISGLSFIYNQDMFNALAYDTNIELENICYYKDDTHYFVMTAKKKSLLERGVLLEDYATTQDLLSDSNIDREALLKYAKDAAFWTTGLEPLDFALNHYGQEDCAMFDFTSMYAASNACKALRTKRDGFTLLSLVGDSLLEPFWPTGSGCARGFLSSFDTAWMCRQWAVNKCAVLDHHHSVQSRLSRNKNPTEKESIKITSEPATHDKMALSVMAERESIYRILAQTTSENLQQNYTHWTLNPHTRYPNLNRHLILPSQVEHLIADNSKPMHKENQQLSPNSGRALNSPNISRSRRSPKKLKSAGASPSTRPKNARNKAKSLAKQGQRSKSRYDISFEDYYLQLEESYRNLDDSGKGGMTQYLNYKRRNHSEIDDLFAPSISGTLPSSHNLSRLEARKARDIDECLRQRRQKTKITVVRDQLISQMRANNQNDSGAPLLSGGNVALFNEIKRMREQQSKGIRSDSRSRDINGPISLLNSIRRCASFAERVKNFESKLANPNVDSSDSNLSTPKTPIDSVRNLPQFATLQELFVNNSQKGDEQTRRSMLPVTRLTKEDWNVKCWENRLLSCKQKDISTSCRSLNKSNSVDSERTGTHGFTKPQKQVDIFQDRINQMANKLNTCKDKQESYLWNHKAGAEPQNSVRSQGWVNHLKRELAKGSEPSRRSNGQAMNPVVPNKPIKKLFEDDENDDGIDVNKHYDHLCINRPTNKYLAKGSYTSHLARKNVKTQVISRPNITSESKQAYLAALTSRGSSASSTLSDYSTNTAHSSNSGGKQTISKTSVIDVECFRCRKFVSSSDRITIGSSLLHRSCLTCANCSITLRSNEIQHYMLAISQVRLRGQQSSTDNEIKFVCAICDPSLRGDLIPRASNLSIGSAQDKESECQNGGQYFEKPDQQHFQSREAFLNSRIDYNELYKNILVAQPSKSSRVNLSNVRQEPSESKSELSGLNSFQEEPNADSPKQMKVAPSPLQVTIPVNLVMNGNQTLSLDHASENNTKTDFSIASSETIDGSEQVTLILPSDSKPATPASADPHETSCNSASVISERRISKEREMMDEEELQRILHLDVCQASLKSTAKSTSASGSGSSADSTEEEDAISKDDEDADSSSSTEDNHLEERIVRSSLDLQIHTEDVEDGSTSDDESSSLDLPPDTDDYDDDDNEDNLDKNSTCNDFITTEEFDTTSDKEEESGNAEDEPASSKAANLNASRSGSHDSVHCNRSARLPASS